MKDQTPPTTHFPWQMAALAAAACAGLTLAAYAVGVRPMLEQRDHEAAQRTQLQERRATASDLAMTVADLQKVRAIVGFVQHHNAIHPWSVSSTGEVKNAIA